MGSEWPTTRLGDVASVRSGFAFKSQDMGDSGYPIIKIKNIDPPRVDISDVQRVPHTVIERNDRVCPFKLAPGDILIAMTGATVGKVGRMPEVSEAYYLNQRVGKVFLDKPEKADYAFLYYVLSQESYVRAMFGVADGSAQANISGGQIEELEIPLPPLKKQQAIACILGVLDDKIELNRRMNETLEAMARAIFKSWFVDFDPVRAKAEGQQPPGLAPHIADLFPDAFEESELGEIPKGWRISELGDVADVNWGDTNVTKKSYVEDGFIAYSAKGPDGFLPYHDYDRTGVVLSAIGANSGYTWLALGKWSCIKNTIRFWSTDETLSTEYLFHATHGNHHWPLRGSAQPFISQGDARKVRVLKPARDLGKLFGEIVRPFHEKVYRSSIENCTLAALRDTLLPRLISGELRVPDAEQIVGRAL